MAGTAGYNIWKFGFQVSPILLVGGIASFVPFAGTLPIVAFTEALHFTIGLLTGPTNLNLDDFFAQFIPMPGSTMIEQDIARYPFANQGIAANATITRPLTVSYQMICPARGRLSYPSKLLIMMALQNVFERHNREGGTYICITPSFIYTDCLMRSMRDTSTGATRQPQNTWQLDFEKPLLALEDSQSIVGSLNSWLNKVTGGQQGVPSLSGITNATYPVPPAVPPAVTGTQSATIINGVSIPSVPQGPGGAGGV